MDDAVKKQIWFVSDLHVDYSANMIWLRELCKGVNPAPDADRDAIIVAGDLSHDPEHIEKALTLIRGVFFPVFFVPGNHDLWVRRQPEKTAEVSSVDRFEELLKLCQKIGVLTNAQAFETTVGWIRILPLFSWYRSDFGNSTSVVTPSEGHAMDDHYCAWKISDGNPADYFARMNRRTISALPDDGVPLLTFSHFLPRAELLPPVESRAFREIAGASGDPLIESQLRECGARMHIYGHTHGRANQKIEGVRYLQNGIGYPIERGPGVTPTLSLLPLEELRSSARPSDVTHHYPY